MASVKNVYAEAEDLVTFLSSPMFQVPVLTFTESNCIVFESGIDDCSSYQEIFADYKKLIDMLLEDLMKQSDLNYYQLVKCVEAMKSTYDHSDLLSVIQEELVAAENYAVFIRLMVQKNIELQQQALLLVMNRTGRTDILQPDTQTAEDDEILRAVLEKSRLEFEEDAKRSAEELAQLREIMASSAAEAALLEERRNQERLLMTQALQSLHLDSEEDCFQNKPLLRNDKQSTQTVPHHAIQTNVPQPTINGRKSKEPEKSSDKAAIVVAEDSISAKSSNKHSKKQLSNVSTDKTTKHAKESSKSPPASSKSPPDVIPTPVSSRQSGPPAKSLSSSEAAANWLKSAQDEAQERTSSAHSRMTAEMSGLSESQIRQRQAYLRKQRDILLEMKKREREKQLDRVHEHQLTSRAAGDAGNLAEVGDEDYDRKLAMRKAIAEKLRSEVMGHL